LTKDS